MQPLDTSCCVAHGATPGNLRLFGEVFTSDLRIRVVATGLGTYPDASVVCGPIQLDPEDPHGHAVVNPRVVFEVLSPSTEEYDRGDQLDQYRRIPSLGEIVLVSQDSPRVDIWRRKSGGFSEHSVTAGPARLESIDCELDLDDLYCDRLAPQA